MLRSSDSQESRCGWLRSVPAATVLLMTLFAASSVRGQVAALGAIEERGDAEPRDERADRGSPPRAIRELGERRLRSRSSVKAIAFSPDGRWIASCGLNADKGVRLWDVASGNLVRTLESPEREWYNAGVVAFSRDGAELLAGHSNGQLSVWDPELGQRLMLVPLHDARITAIAVSSDGRTLWTGGADGQVICSSLTTDAGRRLWTQHVGERQPQGVGAFGGTYGVADMALTPDGRHIVVGVSSAGSILLLRAETGEVVWEIRQAHGEDSSIPGDSLSSITASPDGKQIISGGNRTMRREDVPREIISYSKNINICQVRVWNLATGESISDLLQGRYEHGWGHAGLSPDGRTIALGKRDELQLIASDSGKLLWSARVDGWWGRRPVFSPDGTLIAAPVSNAAGLWDSRTGKRLHADRPGHGGGVSAAAYCPTGRLIASGGGSDLNVWDAETGEHRFHKTLGSDSSIWKVEFAPGGEYVAVCGETKDAQGRPIGIVVLWSPAGEEVAVAHLPQRGEGLAISPDGDRFVVAYSTGSIGDTRLELWRLGPRGNQFRAFRDARRIAEFPRNPDSGLSQYKAIHFAPDGRHLLIAEYDGRVTRWDTSDAEDSTFVADWRTEERGATERVPWIGQAVFTPDGTRLITSTRENLYVWDVSTGKLEREIAAPQATHGFRALGVAMDNRTLAASDTVYAGAPGIDAIRLFDLMTGEELLMLELDDDRAASCAFSPDGEKLVTGLWRGTAMVWDIRAPGN